jgi:beta-lactamase class A
MARAPQTDPLRCSVERAAEAAGARRVAAAYYDYETRTAWSYHGEEWFHAASTIKVAVLVGVFGAVESGRLAPDSRVHVRNRFLSVADGKPFRVESARDANAEVQNAIGRSMKVDELAYHMIVTSSNLATNLLIDVVGLEEIRATLDELGVEGVELQRGVEDERAYEEGISNRVTADGLVYVLRLIEEGRALSVEASARMLEILTEQQFRAGIPAGVPEHARVANKTGEISTIAHDAGIVYLPGRKPYVVVVLSEWEPRVSGRRSEMIAGISRLIYEQLTHGEGGETERGDRDG